jgi:serpin B
MLSRRVALLLAVTCAAAHAAPADDANAFGFDLYGQLRARPGNLALSPASIAVALTMAWAGAGGETATQMRKVLHLEGDRGAALAAAGGLLARSDKLTLVAANRLFGEQSYRFAPAYLDALRAGFGAPLEAVDFAGAPDATRRHINAWVAAATKDRIKDLLPDQSILPTTKLVIANAIYFLADWARPFKKEATAPAPFHVSATAAHDVPMMRQTASFRYAATGGVKLLEMEYEGGDAAMLLVLPDAVDGLAAVEADLGPARLAAWLGALAQTRVAVALPRVTIDPGALALVEPLRALGMPLAFDRAKADFSGMTAKPDLYITHVFHKAFVKIDEKGTEAAAATAVVMGPRGAPAAQPEHFDADHPFLFLLRDTRSGAVLFIGRVADPAP